MKKNNIHLFFAQNGNSMKMYERMLLILNILQALEMIKKTTSDTNIDAYNQTIAINAFG